MIIGLERRHEKLATRRRFARNMSAAILIWIVMISVGLGIGIAGYIAFAEMPLVDAFVNAAMILSGMGPVGELKSTSAKVFAGCYAIFSGLIIVIATGIVLAPIFHRVLHRFHIESRE